MKFVLILIVFIIVYIIYSFWSYKSYKNADFVQFNNAYYHYYLVLSFLHDSSYDIERKENIYEVYKMSKRLNDGNNFFQKLETDGLYIEQKNDTLYIICKGSDKLRAFNENYKFIDEISYVEYSLNLTDILISQWPDK